ncbi:MAG: glycosyltransferase family protein [Thermodesulfobacteriota bacterium]
MARIVFGIMGDAHGHLSQALYLARELPEHEFLFLGGGTVLELKSHGYNVEELPMPATLYHRNRVDVAKTMINTAKVLSAGRRVIQRLMEIYRSFDPALVLTAYEFFSPLAARRLDLPSLSVDNHHTLTHCRYPRPRHQRLNRLMTLTPMRWMFSWTDRDLISSFYQFPPRNPARTEVFPPLQPRGIRELTPSEGDHVLVYQTSATFHRLLEALEARPDRFVVYGLGARPPLKNCVFKGFSREGFLADLASCRYFITNGGHNAVAEALFLGKPVLSFPIHLAYEQFFNAWMVSRLGYGEYSLETHPGPELLVYFEKRLDDYRTRIKTGNFWGNEVIAARVREIIDGRPGGPRTG